MDILIAGLALVAAFLVLGVLAIAFGHDSRESFDREADSDVNGAREWFAAGGSR
jgi:hypothetical protein